MKLILLKDVPNLGEEGEVKIVANGYGRNYLLPGRFAMPYNKANLTILEQKKVAIDKRKKEKMALAVSLKEKIGSQLLELAIPTGEKGRLFGSITSAMIVEGLAAMGIEVEKKKIEIPAHVKTVGTYVVKIKLYAGETAELKVEVKASEKPEDRKIAKKAAEDAEAVAAKQIAADEAEVAAEAAAKEVVTEEAVADVPAEEEAPAAETE